MKISKLNPQAVIDKALKDAERTIDQVSQGAQQVSKDIAGKLPTALKQVADGFDADKLDRGQLLDGFKQALESHFAQSLQKGELVADEAATATKVTGHSQVGVQLEQSAIAAQKGTQTIDGVNAATTAALTGAEQTVTSQLEVFQTLKDAEQVHQSQDPAGETAKMLKDVVKQRGKLLRKVVDNTVKQAELAVKQAGEPGAQEALQVVLQAAIDVHKAVSPTGSGLKRLQKKQKDAGLAPDVGQAQAQPFFARFLESQQQVNKGEAPSITDQSSPGDAVTAKFPSDAEDGGADGDIGAVTAKWPSDAEDGAVGEKPGDDLGDMMVTRKFPSDNEDGGADGIGDMVTLKFPSDNEDGAGGTDPGIPVTLKFPSDNEDSPMPELIVELAPELRPELIPEIAPELRPELIPEIAPEVRPDPGELTPIQKDMLATEGAVMKSAFRGVVGINERIAEIDDILMRAMVSPDGITKMGREKRALEAFLGGADDMKHAISKLQHTLTAARLTPEGLASVKAEIAMYERLIVDLDPLVSHLGTLETRRFRTPAQDAETGVLRAFLEDGEKGMNYHMEQLGKKLSSTSDPKAQDQIKLEMAGLKAFMHGHEVLEGRIDEIDRLFMTATMTPEMSQRLGEERSLMKALLGDVKVFENRAVAIGDELAGRPLPHPELIPEIAPELLPEVRPIPELIAEIAPELIPELIPEIAPEVRPDPGGELSPLDRRALQIEQAVTKAAFHGEEQIQARIDEIDDLFTKARLTPEGKTRLSQEQGALRTWQGGIDAIDDKIKELERLPTVALMSEEGMKELQAEVGMYRSLRKDMLMLEARVDQLGRRRHRTPAESAEASVLKTALHGFDAMEKRQIEIHNTLTTARLSQPAYEALVLEAEGLKAFRSGGPGIEKQLKDLQLLMLNFGGTQQEHNKAINRQELLEGLLADLKQFRSRAGEIDDQLDPPVIPFPELIPEIAPETIPHELIAEIAPELRPAFELIPELSPDRLPDDD